MNSISNPESPNNPSAVTHTYRARYTITVSVRFEAAPGEAREVAANLDLADICENAEPGETIELDSVELA